MLHLLTKDIFSFIRYLFKLINVYTIDSTFVLVNKYNDKYNSVDQSATSGSWTFAYLKTRINKQIALHSIFSLQNLPFALLPQRNQFLFT